MHCTVCTYACSACVFIVCVSVHWSGSIGAVDRKCWSHLGEQRPDLTAAEDSIWTSPHLLHPADLPLHL